MIRSLCRRAWSLLHAALLEITGWLGVLRGWFSSSEQMVHVWPEGEAPLGPRVALFVHFDRAGVVRRHVLDYLAALREAGLTIAFVTNSGRLQPDSMTALQRLCAAVLVRRNVGYDFGAMREGLARLGLPRADTELLVIANDSVYGPLRPLQPLLARADFGRADLWGATDSWQRRYHLQSYFLVAGRAALTSEAWRAFWRDVRPVRSKHWVISRYEVGLTQRLLAGGLRCAALWPYRDLVRRIDVSLLANGQGMPVGPFTDARRDHVGRVARAVATRAPLNPTAEFWRELLEAGFPFIKRELLRKNPARVLDIGDWHEAVDMASSRVLDAIERDLQRVMKNRVS